MDKRFAVAAQFMHPIIGFGNSYPRFLSVLPIFDADVAGLANLARHRGIDPVRMMRTRFANAIRAGSLFGLHQQAGHMTASDLCAARHMTSCQAGAIHT
jgi:hypothetical protein